MDQLNRQYIYIFMLHICVKYKKIRFIYFLLLNLIGGASSFAQCQLQHSLGVDTIKVCGMDTVRLSSNLKSDSLSYLWSTGDSTAAIVSNKLLGKIKLTIKSTLCTSTDSVFIIRSEQPNINQIRSTVVCAGVPTELSHQSTYPANSTIIWTLGKGKDSISNQNSLRYLYPGNGGQFKFYLSIQTPMRCFYKDSALVKVNPLPAVEILGIPANFCQGDSSIQIRANLAGGFFYGKNVIENYNINNDFSFYNPVSEGKDTIRYEYRDVNGCFNFTQRGVVIYPKPKVNLGKDVNIMPGQQLTIGVENNPQHRYLWSNGLSASKINVSNPGFYILTATDKISSCFATDTILVDLTLSTWHPMELTTIKVYPNPVRDFVTIYFTTLESREIRARLYSLINVLSIQTVKSGARVPQSIMFDLRLYPNGIYFISIDGHSWPILLKK